MFALYIYNKKKPQNIYPHWLLYREARFNTILIAILCSIIEQFTFSDAVPSLYLT